ncbi:lipopolysaccharide biosynthesis protein [Jatrophihabitans sp. DSM 45814]
MTELPMADTPRRSDAATSGHEMAVGGGAAGGAAGGSGTAGGIGIVALALIASGVLVNVYLAIVARNLAPKDYLYFSSYWSLALVVGFGVFLPIEQELARLLQGASSHRAALRSALRVAAGLAGIELVLVLAGAPLLLPSLGHHVSALIALAVFCLVSGVQFVVRGVLIGLNRMRLYAGVLLLDGVLRVVFAALLGHLVEADSAGYAWTLVAAVAVAHFPVLFVALQHGVPEGLPDSGTPVVPVVPGTPVVRVVPGESDLALESGSSARAMAKAVGPLLLGSLAAQLLLNGIPILVAATAGVHQQVAAGQFQAAFQLVRIPLFLAVPLQTTILPALTTLFRSGRRDLVVSVMTRFVMLLIALAATGLVIAYGAGPLAMHIVFGDRYDVSRNGLAILSLGVTFYLGLVLITQALVAAGLHIKVAWSWLAGLAAATVVYFVVPDFVLAAELSFLIGSGVGWLVGMTQLPVWKNEPATSGGARG